MNMLPESAPGVKHRETRASSSSVRPNKPRKPSAKKEASGGGLCDMFFSRLFWTPGETTKESTLYEHNMNTEYMIQMTIWATS